MRALRVLSVSSLCLAALIAVPLLGCKTKQKVTVVFEGEDDEEKKKAAAEQGRSEEALREAYEKRIAERENQPEPELDPNDPREKFELVWHQGKGKLNSIYSERAEMLAMLRRTNLEDKADKALVEPWFDRLTEFGIGREPATMERAPTDLCKLISEVRVPAEKLIASGEEQLVALKKQEDELVAHADAGGTVYQKQWDKLDADRSRWSGPVTAGKQMLLVVKSMLEEGYVLADLGPRRVQIALRDCLTAIAEQPLELNLAQDQLEATIKRSRWYRDLR